MEAVLHIFLRQGIKEVEIIIIQAYNERKIELRFNVGQDQER